MTRASRRRRSARRESLPSPRRAWLKTAQSDSPRDTRLVSGEVTCMMLIEFGPSEGERVTMGAGAGMAGRSSLASKIRGWKDDATGLEQRLRDLEPIPRSHRPPRLRGVLG